MQQPSQCLFCARTLPQVSNRRRCCRQHNHRRGAQESATKLLARKETGVDVHQGRSPSYSLELYQRNNTILYLSSSLQPLGFMRLTFFKQHNHLKQFADMVDQRRRREAVERLNPLVFRSSKNSLILFQ